MRAKQSIRAGFMAAAFFPPSSLVCLVFSNPSRGSFQQERGAALFHRPESRSGLRWNDSPPANCVATSTISNGMQANLTHSISADEDVSWIVGNPTTNPTVDHGSGKD